MFADTSFGGVTHKVLIGTLTGFHTVVTIVTLWTQFSALSAHPAGGTATHPIVEPTLPAILALALLIAVHAECPRRARLRTRLACPARQTLARACDVMAFSAILADTGLAAVLSVAAHGAGVLAGGAHITRPAHILACHMVTRLVSIFPIRALFATTRSIESGLTGQFTVVSLPAPFTMALAVVLVTRGSVLARTLFRTVRTEKSTVTRRFAFHSSPGHFALALSANMVAVDDVVYHAFALLFTASAEPAFGTLLLTELAKVTRGTVTSAIDWFAACIVLA